MRGVLPFVALAVFGHCLAEVKAQVTNYHLFLENCNISSAPLSPPIAYTGPTPPQGFHECLVSSTELLFCIHLNAEFGRRVAPPAVCPTDQLYPYCPSIKGTTWGMSCDNPSAPTYTANVPVGFKYCVGTTTSLSACADVADTKIPSKLSFGFLRGEDSDAKYEEQPVATFIQDTQVDDTVKTVEKTTFPLIKDNVPLSHCIFQDGAMVGCRSLESVQYKDKLPYLGFTGIYFRKDREVQGYIATLPTITGMQYAWAGLLQYLTDSIFASANLSS